MLWAEHNGRVVLTHDLDYGAILAATQMTAPSVVQVRTQDVRPHSLAPLLISVLRPHKTELDSGRSLSWTKRSRAFDCCLFKRGRKTDRCTATGPANARRREIHSSEFFILRLSRKDLRRSARRPSASVSRDTNPSPEPTIKVGFGPRNFAPKLSESLFNKPSPFNNPVGFGGAEPTGRREAVGELVDPLMSNGDD